MPTSDNDCDTTVAALPDGHPMIGEGYRLLTADDVLHQDDETVCVSTLFSGRECWTNVFRDDPDGYDNSALLGKTVLQANSDDLDGHERLWRRLCRAGGGV